MTNPPHFFDTKRLYFSVVINTPLQGEPSAPDIFSRFLIRILFCRLRHARGEKVPTSLDLYVFVADKSRQKGIYSGFWKSYFLYCQIHDGFTSKLRGLAAHRGFHFADEVASGRGLTLSISIDRCLYPRLIYLLHCYYNRYRLKKGYKRKKTKYYFFQKVYPFCYWVMTEWKKLQKGAGSWCWSLWWSAPCFWWSAMPWFGSFPAVKGSS